MKKEFDDDVDDIHVENDQEWSWRQQKQQEQRGRMKRGSRCNHKGIASYQIDQEPVLKVQRMQSQKKNAGVT